MFALGPLNSLGGPVTAKAQKSHVREMHQFTKVGSVQCVWSYSN